MRLGLSAALLVGVFAASLSRDGWAGQSWGIEVSGGWNTYTLEAVNDSLASFNQQVGTAFDSIQEGAAAGVALRFWANEGLLLRLCLEKDWAVANDPAVRHFDIGTLDALLGATYYPLGRGALRFGGGLAIGATWIRGRFTGWGFALDTGGSGVDIRANAEALWYLARGGFLTISAGGRYASVGEVLIQGQGMGAEADFSGPILRVAAGFDGSPASHSK